MRLLILGDIQLSMDNMNMVNVSRVGKFEGTVLKSRFQVGRLLGLGSFSKIYKVERSSGVKNSRHMVVKASKDMAMLYHEI